MDSQFEVIKIESNYFPIRLYTAFGDLAIGRAAAKLTNFSETALTLHVRNTS
jgi:hypothetical protein